MAAVFLAVALVGGASAYLQQLERPAVVSRCPCGCASVDFEVTGMPEPSGGLHILGDYVFGKDTDLGGAFIVERAGVLAGIEVYGLGGMRRERCRSRVH